MRILFRTEGGRHIQVLQINRKEEFIMEFEKLDLTELDKLSLIHI